MKSEAVENAEQSFDKRKLAAELKYSSMEPERTSDYSPQYTSRVENIS